MVQTSNLTVLLFFFMLYSFLTKCQVLNFKVGRSRDQVLQRAHYYEINSGGKVCVNSQVCGCNLGDVATSETIIIKQK